MENRNSANSSYLKTQAYFFTPKEADQGKEKETEKKACDSLLIQKGAKEVP